ELVNVTPTTLLEQVPETIASLSDIPLPATPAATRLSGWEFVTTVEGVGEVSEERGIQETLLHIAVRTGCVDLVQFFIAKGNINVLHRCQKQKFLDSASVVLLLYYHTPNFAVLYISLRIISTIV